MSEKSPNQARTFSCFADWCRNKDDLSPQARHTVDQLLTEADTSDCQEAERRLSSLTTLDLSQRQISDISPLTCLTGLNGLSLSSNQISDISPLAHLTGLNWLALKENQICDLSPLSSLTQLRSLELAHNQISDITPLLSLSQLSEVFLSGNQISDLSPLANLTQLNKLFLSGNQISDLSPLANLTQLNYLVLPGNQISDLSPLTKLTQLDILVLAINQISNLSSLAHLSKLSELFLSSNHISDLSPLAGLSGLNGLFLCDNQISDISPLAALSGLNGLSLASNQISDISPLAHLTGLNWLALKENQISDLSPLSSLTQLRSLELAHNQISDITPLLALSQLSHLDLSENQISDITPSAALWTKWHTLCSQPIKHQQAKAAVNSVYAVLGQAAPRVIFCTSPYAALAVLSNISETEYESQGTVFCLFEQLSDSIMDGLSWGLWIFFQYYINFQRGWNLNRQIKEQLLSELQTNFIWNQNLVTPTHLVQLIVLAQCLTTNSSWVPNQKAQEVLHCLDQLLECGWIFAFEKLCIVCDRPIKLSFDAQDRLHAEGEPAIQFADGWNTKYYYHGVELPEKLGQLHPAQWQMEWILEEENTELRRALIQGIGYARISQVLQVVELDSWQEYTLLKIDVDIDEEPIHLLRMTCPSTGFIHAMRVPPDMVSAREAISWVNWEIDPEEFAVQT